MRDDLLDAYAAVRWGHAHLPVLERRVLSWNEHAIEIISKNSELDARRKVWVAREKEPLPLLVYGDVGAIIGSIRSALDLLAAALAKRNGVTPNHNTHFPIFRSIHDFMDPIKGLKGKQWLSKAEIGIIESFKPYEGGNDVLWPLHRLDILRKHERLIFVTVRPLFLNVMFTSASDYGPIVFEARRLEHETTLVELPANMPDPRIGTTLTIVFDEIAIGLPEKPAIPILRRFGDEVAKIISLFDR